MAAAPSPIPSVPTPPGFAPAGAGRAVAGLGGVFAAIHRLRLFSALRTLIAGLLVFSLQAGLLAGLAGGAGCCDCAAITECCLRSCPGDDKAPPAENAAADSQCGETQPAGSPCCPAGGDHHRHHHASCIHSLQLLGCGEGLWSPAPLHVNTLERDWNHCRLPNPPVFELDKPPLN